MDGWIRIGTKVETKDFDAQIKYLEKKADEMEKVLESDLQVPIELRMDEEGRLKLKSDLQKTKNQIISLQEQANKDNPKNFESMIKSAKRFALSLISIHGIYALLSKASQAYMQTDEETSNQMEANWIGLGAILSPVIELITRLFKKAVTSILHFMSVLTGVNYIEKANAAILKKQTQATNELTKANDKAIASFDEMNILSDTSSSKNSDSIDTNALFSLSDISENTKRNIEKIAEALRPVYDILKSIIDFSIKNPEVILGILGGVGLLGMIKQIIGYVGMGTAVGTGLAGILGVLTAIASIGVITISIKTIIDEVSKLEEGKRDAKTKMEGNKKRSDELLKSSVQIGKQSDKNSKSIENLDKQYSTIANNALENLKGYVKESKEIEKSWFGLGEGLRGLTDETHLLEKAQEDSIDEAYKNIVAYYDLYKQNKLNNDETKDYIETLNNFVTTIGAGGTSVQELSGHLEINTTAAKRVKQQYENVSAMLVQVTDGSDEATKKTSILNFTLKSVPSSVKSKIVVDAKETLNKLDTANTLINTLPSTKKIILKVVTDTNNTQNKFKGIFNGLISNANNIFKSLGLKFKIPKLAVGGIVNNPGRGVPIGGAITGEAGREGVLPLTDAGTMQELGYEIGKWITVNATLNNYMNGRLIQRQVKQIEQDNNFATNGRQ